MKSLYNNTEANTFSSDLDLRVYTSRLLGQESSLVLHGGGNTSVKSHAVNLFGEKEEILYVKGSGWDLATIEDKGFAPVKMDMLLKMAKLSNLKDSDMVKYQRLAMTDPSAPNPSVEAILHAIIPFKYVDHTHADAVVTITNTPNGEDKIRELYGEKVLIIPYIMPGFVLAQLVYEMTKDIDFNELEGMVLMNHGLFTFSDDAKESYEKTIELVSKAEEFLKNRGATLTLENSSKPIDALQIATLRKEISALKQHPTILKINQSALAYTFAKADIEHIATQGPLTPDHVIRTKRIPAILNKDFKSELTNYAKAYEAYFDANKSGETLLNSAPNFAILKDVGSICFGKSIKEANIINDITEHTFEAILKAEKLDKYKALDASKIFEVEYWELEQAKLKKASTSAKFAGKIALITEANISQAIISTLTNNGCSVIALYDLKETMALSNRADIINLSCDSTCKEDIEKTIKEAILSFGGLDILVTANKSFYDASLKYLELGINPKVLLINSEDTIENTTIQINRLQLTNKTLNIGDLVSTILSNSFDETKTLEIRL